MVYRTAGRPDVAYCKRTKEQTSALEAERFLAFEQRIEATGTHLQLASGGGTCCHCRRRCTASSAQSVAFIVADAQGLGTDEITFPYVPSWAGVDGLRIVESSAERVAAAMGIVTASTVEHTTGGRITGVDMAPTNRWAPGRAPSPEAGSRLVTSVSTTLPELL